MVTRILLVNCLEKETISVYPERMGLFLQANGTEEAKQAPALLTTTGGETYALLRNLLVPTKPIKKIFTQLKEALQWHFDPKPLVIAELFYFIVDGSKLGN